MREQNLTYHLVTLGCPKNKVDSDGIEMLLREATYAPTESVRNADVLIVNTCGFLEAAKEESIGVLQELGRQKRRNQILIAAGCLAQRNGDEVLARAQGGWPTGHTALDGRDRVDPYHSTRSRDARYSATSFWGIQPQIIAPLYHARRWLAAALT
ncbi:MAG: hypothetical protein R3E79_10615 [Caldilineaceae bacterium]